MKKRIIACSITESRNFLIYEKEIENIIKDYLTDLLNKKEENIGFMKGMSPHVNKMIEILEELGAEVFKDAVNTSGWDYDFWIPFCYKGERFALSGDNGDCGYLSFYINQ